MTIIDLPESACLDAVFLPRSCIVPEPTLLWPGNCEILEDEPVELPETTIIEDVSRPMRPPIIVKTITKSDRRGTLIRWHVYAFRVQPEWCCEREGVQDGGLYLEVDAFARRRDALDAYPDAVESNRAPS